MRIALPITCRVALTVALVATSTAVAAPRAVGAQIGSSLTGGSGGTAPDLATALRVAFGLPRMVSASAYLSRQMVVEAVFQATILSGAGMMGQVRNTGTLSPGYGGAYQYSPQPTDRLVLHYAGQVHEFVVHEAVGNPQAATADAWVLSPHRLRYSHRMADQVEAEIQISYDGSAFEVGIQGWTTQWGQRYDLDLHSSGRVGGVRDYSGQDIQMTYDVTGTIAGAGASVDVRERHTSALVAAMGLSLLPSQRGSASNSSSTLESTLTFSGARYVFQDVQVQSGSSARGGQGSAGMTGLSGSVLRDGQPFGVFVFQAGRAFLQTSDGTISMDGM